MDKKYGLSPTEYEIMDYLWAAGEAKSFKEILYFFNNISNKEWKKQTLSTYLKILQEQSLIAADTASIRNKYYPTCTKAQHIHNWTVNLCETSFDSSIGKLVAAYSGGEKLDKKSVDELKEYLKQYDSP